MTRNRNSKQILKTLYVCELKIILTYIVIKDMLQSNEILIYVEE